ncbi:MAG: AtpZ/AtpI family protein [Proteobacteria bacterium]|nr:AtpZ/AtpI family protein [Pseudomonadota bacterium]
MDEHEKPLPSLDDLQRKIEEVQANTGMKTAGENADNSPNSVGSGLQVGIELVSGVAVGSFLGFFLDRWLGTMPLFFIVCFFVGAAAGFRNLIRSTRQTDE